MISTIDAQQRLDGAFSCKILYGVEELDIDEFGELQFIIDWMRDKSGKSRVVLSKDSTGRWVETETNGYRKRIRKS